MKGYKIIVIPFLSKAAAAQATTSTVNCLSARRTDARRAGSCLERLMVVVLLASSDCFARFAATIVVSGQVLFGATHRQAGEQTQRQTATRHNLSPLDKRPSALSIVALRSHLRMKPSMASRQQQRQQERATARKRKQSNSKG